MRAGDDQDDEQVLQVRIEVSDRRADVVLTGELDLEGAAVVADRLADDRLGSDDAVVIDLSGVSFIDSEGIRVLLTLQERRGARLCRPSARVRHTFELMAIDDRLEADS